MRCPSCGNALPDSAPDFCPGCGARLPSTPTAPIKTSPTADTPKKCAAGPCQDMRVPGTNFCAKHGPKEMPQARISGKSKGPGRFDRFVANMEAEQERKRAQDARIVCPYCHKAGQVSTKSRRVKRGVSGGKATGALITGGLSIFATGLSRKEDVIEAHCANCGMTWQTQADR